MSTELLFGQFATLATAPDGITRLRELILQLAVKGKLGTQDARDEPASVLLERIKAEKKQLIKNGKIRQEQPLEPIEDDNFQKNLPVKWHLSKLGEYCLIIMGQSPESKYYNEHGSGLPFYQGKSEFGKLFPKPKVWCENPLKIAQKNDILISVRAPVGPTNICPSESCIGRGLTALRSLSGTSNFFLLYSLRASEKLIAEKGVGSTFSAISKTDLDNFLIAIPPLAEQHRIVAKVDRLMGLCDELEARQQQERAGCLKLGTTSFTRLQDAESSEDFGQQWTHVFDAFDLLLDCPENVAGIRQTILHLAFRGKLTEQFSDDESAKILLKRIEKNAQKNENKKYRENLRKLKEINYPLIPESWTWCNLNSIFNFVTSGSRGWAEYYSTEGALFIRIGNITRNSISLDLRNIQKVAPPESAEKTRTLIHKNDILVTITADIGSIGFVSKDIGEAYINQHIALCRPVREIDPEYLAWYLLSDTGGKRQFSELQRGGTKIGLGLDDIKAISLPLPPLAEQHRIVAKVNELMALCNTLEARLKERAGVQGRYANAVVNKVAG